MVAIPTQASLLWALRPVSPTSLASQEAAAGRKHCLLWEQGRAEASQCTNAFCEHMLNEEANSLSALPHGYLGSFQAGICFAGHLGFIRGQKVLAVVCAAVLRSPRLRCC